MRILIFTQYYSPEPPLRPSELAPALAARRHDVVVITGYPSYPLGRLYPGYSVLGWRWETLEGVRVLRLPVFADHSQSPIRRTLFYSSVALGACVAGPLVGRNFDVGFVYSPPPTLGAAASLTRLIRGVPFVYDVQDLWPESLPATGMVRSRWAMWLVESLVRHVARRAAAITVISPGFRDHFVRRGVPPAKLHVVPNWANEDVYRPVARDSALAEELGFNGHFNVLYAGVGAHVDPRSP